ITEASFSTFEDKSAINLANVSSCLLIMDVVVSKLFLVLSVIQSKIFALSSSETENMGTIPLYVSNITFCISAMFWLAISMFFFVSSIHVAYDLLYMSKPFEKLSVTSPADSLDPLLGGIIGIPTSLLSVSNCFIPKLYTLL